MMNVIQIREKVQQRNLSLSEKLILGFLASIVLGVCAQLRMYLPFSPIPIVMQNTLILFLAALLGRQGALMMAFSFLVQGVIGFPVFASGYIGVAALVGPTGGYLFGYLVGSYVVGALAEKRAEITTRTLFSDMCAGGLVVYFFGAIYLSTIVGSLPKALLIGVVPYIIGDLIKTSILTTVFSVIGNKKKDCY